MKIDLDTKKRLIEVLYFITLDKLHRYPRPNMSQVVENLALHFGTSPILAQRLYEKMRHPSYTPPMDERIITLLVLGYQPRQVARILTCSHTKVYQVKEKILQKESVQLVPRHQEKEQQEMMNFTKNLFQLFGQFSELTGSKEAEDVWK